MYHTCNPPKITPEHPHKQTTRYQQTQLLSDSNQIITTNAKEKKTFNIPNGTAHAPRIPTAPKPYHLRQPKQQHKKTYQVTIQKRSIARHTNAELQPQLAPIRRNSTTQALPRINMAFPTPSTMPRKNKPSNTNTYKQNKPKWTNVKTGVKPNRNSHDKIHP